MPVVVRESEASVIGWDGICISFEGIVRSHRFRLLWGAMRMNVGVARVNVC